MAGSPTSPTRAPYPDNPRYYEDAESSLYPRGHYDPEVEKMLDSNINGYRISGKDRGVGKQTKYKGKKWMPLNEAIDRTLEESRQMDEQAKFRTDMEKLISGAPDDEPQKTEAPKPRTMSRKPDVSNSVKTQTPTPKPAQPKLPAGSYVTDPMRDSLGNITRPGQVYIPGQGFQGAGGVAEYQRKAAAPRYETGQQWNQRNASRPGINQVVTGPGGNIVYSREEVPLTTPMPKAPVHTNLSGPAAVLKSNPQPGPNDIRNPQFKAPATPAVVGGAPMNAQSANSTAPSVTGTPTPRVPSMGDNGKVGANAFTPISAPGTIAPPLSQPSKFAAFSPTRPYPQAPVSSGTPTPKPAPAPRPDFNSGRSDWLGGSTPAANADGVALGLNPTMEGHGARVFAAMNKNVAQRGKDFEEQIKPTLTPPPSVARRDALNAELNAKGMQRNYDRDEEMKRVGSIIQRNPIGMRLAGGNQLYDQMNQNVPRSRTNYGAPGAPQFKSKPTLDGGAYAAQAKAENDAIPRWTRNNPAMTTALTGVGLLASTPKPVRKTS